MTNNISVILVSGGSPDYTSVELLHTNGTRLCSLPNLPSSRRQHTQTGLTACGGWGDISHAASTNCLTLSSTSSWIQSHTLAGQGRQYHSAWASPQGTILLGGYYTAVSGQHQRYFWRTEIPPQVSVSTITLCKCGTFPVDVNITNCVSAFPARLKRVRQSPLPEEIILGHL